MFDFPGMFDLSAYLNLPMFFVGILALAVFLYVLLDGFDLGVGILFPFAPSKECRDKMMNSITPFWDGNETWLVFGGMGLFAAFPVAYSMIIPAFYIPIIMMLLGLIFRGVAIEFRSKSETEFQQKIWDYSFHFGSLVATFFQGVILGSVVQGFYCDNATCNIWYSFFSFMVGVALVFGYALLGSTWLILKTHGKTQDWARKITKYILAFVVFFILIVSAWTPSLNEQIFIRWFSRPNIFYLAPIPLLTIATLIYLLHSLKSQKERAPFCLTILLFILCYFGIAVTLFPYIIPYQVPYKNMAAAPQSLSFLFVGMVVTLPVILGYTFYSYRVFRGKSSRKKMY
jgi:cytochrome bd ubiquinol oxidase subunit II